MASSYYEHCFPYDDVLRFATLHHEDRPENREFATTNANDIWRRYNSVKTPSELRKLVMGAGAGASLHLGPFYNEASHRARVPGVVPVGKQLPFDLDLTDVAFLNVPKQDQSQNDRYVRLIFAQVHVLKTVLNVVFGFEHFLPVYSGRRGAHLWVLDERASALSDEARKAIATMITPPNSRSDARVCSRRAILANPTFWDDAIHAALREARDRVLCARFSEGGVGMFDSKTRVELFLDNFFDSSAKSSRVAPGAPPSKWRVHELDLERRVRAAMRGVTGPETLATLEGILESQLQPASRGVVASNGNGCEKLKPYEVACKEALEKLHNLEFSLLWPTLDAGPSAQMGHCVKLPFSEHSSTGRIALPIERLLPRAGTSPTPSTPSLPPVVTADDLRVPGEKNNLFLKSVAFFRATVARARRGAAPVPSNDIEDLVTTELHDLPMVGAKVQRVA